MGDRLGIEGVIRLRRTLTPALSPWARELVGTRDKIGSRSRSETSLALERLNPLAAADAINSAVDELARDRSAMSLAGANREVWELVRDGVKVAVPDRERGGQKTERVRVVDWEKPLANDFCS